MRVSGIKGGATRPSPLPQDMVYTFPALHPFRKGDSCYAVLRCTYKLFFAWSQSSLSTLVQCSQECCLDARVPWRLCMLQQCCAPCRRHRLLMHAATSRARGSREIRARRIRVRQMAHYGRFATADAMTMMAASANASIRTIGTASPTGAARTTTAIAALSTCCKALK